jgi:single-strand DNA-binding protein
METVMPYPTINRVLLLGRLTRDPQLRELSSGETVCVLRVACNSKRRGDEGSYEEKPNYFDIDVFGAPGQHVARHAHKGERVAVDGQLESREWKNSFQERREAVSIVAGSVRCLSGRPRRRAPRQLELVGADEATLAF